MQQQSTSNLVRTLVVFAYVWRITCTGGARGRALVSIVTDDAVRVTSIVLRYWLCGGWDLSRLHGLAVDEVEIRRGHLLSVSMAIPRNANGSEAILLRQRDLSQHHDCGDEREQPKWSDDFG